MGIGSDLLNGLQVSPTVSTLGSALAACERVSQWTLALWMLQQADEERHGRREEFQ